MMAHFVIVRARIPVVALALLLLAAARVPAVELQEPLDPDLGLLIGLVNPVGFDRFGLDPEIVVHVMANHDHSRGCFGMGTLLELRCEDGMFWAENIAPCARFLVWKITVTPISGASVEFFTAGPEAQYLDVRGQSWPDPVLTLGTFGLEDDRLVQSYVATDIGVQFQWLVAQRGWEYWLSDQTQQLVLRGGALHKEPGPVVDGAGIEMTAAVRELPDGVGNQTLSTVRTHTAAGDSDRLSTAPDNELVRDSGPEVDGAETPVIPEPPVSQDRAIAAPVQAGPELRPCLTVVIGERYVTGLSVMAVDHGTQTYLALDESAAREAGIGITDQALVSFVNQSSGQFITVELDRQLTAALQMLAYKPYVEKEAMLCDQP